MNFTEPNPGHTSLQKNCGDNNLQHSPRIIMEVYCADDGDELILVSCYSTLDQNIPL